MFNLALRSLLSHPIRSAVLAGGFGIGVSVMASLLGIGEVILEQARAPALLGGGDIVITGMTGKVPSARFILSSVLNGPSLRGRVAGASPTLRKTLYLVRDRRVVPIRVRGGIPSMEHAIGDLETTTINVWRDAPTDAKWTTPDPTDLLRVLDRFHPVPKVPIRAESWAEWLYFSGQAGQTRFYLTFLIGPKRGSDRRIAAVRLQLDRNGDVCSYSDFAEVDEVQVLANAPDLTIGRNQVRLNDQRYVVKIDLQANQDGEASECESRITGEIALEAKIGRVIPPITLKGNGGWVSGYVVPVMSGGLTGVLNTNDDLISLDNGVGYHDHNWGYWEGVSWQWGQVHGGGLSFVYGRLQPPTDAFDPDYVPAFVAIIGPDGPVGYTTDVSIEETDEGTTGEPRRIVVHGRGRTFDVTMELNVEDVLVSRMHQRPFVGSLDFYQLRAEYHVTGHANNQLIDFTSRGTAETFRGR